MAELKNESHSHLNISSEVEVLSYTHTGAEPIEVVARIDAGLAGGLLSGVGGLYIASAYIGSGQIMPVGEVIVAAGKTRAIFVSKALPLSSGETISLRIQGQMADTSVNTIASLRNATPLRSEDVYGGGPVLVDHDYGGADNLSYRFSDETGIAGADVVAYLQTDYTAGRRSIKDVVARTTTQGLGRWAKPLMLNPGTYTIVCYKQGQAGPDAKQNLVVS